MHIWNINNGERFITYAIRAERSRIISTNGSAARRAAGDLVIIAAFAQVHEDQVSGFVPLVFVNPDNRIKEERSTIPVQMATNESLALIQHDYQFAL